MPETVKIKRLQDNGTNNVYLELQHNGTNNAYLALFVTKNNNSDFNTVNVLY